MVHCYIHTITLGQLTHCYAQYGPSTVTGNVTNKTNPLIVSEIVILDDNEVNIHIPCLNCNLSEHQAQVFHCICVYVEGKYTITRILFLYFDVFVFHSHVSTTPRWLMIIVNIILDIPGICYIYGIYAYSCLLYITTIFMYLLNQSRVKFIFQTELLFQTV